MADCSLIDSCIFFKEKMQNMPSMTKMYKQRYCKGEMEQCARYQVYKEVGKGNVPDDLYPNDSAKVEEVLRKVLAK